MRQAVQRLLIQSFDGPGSYGVGHRPQVRWVGSGHGPPALARSAIRCSTAARARTTAAVAQAPIPLRHASSSPTSHSSTFPVQYLGGPGSTPGPPQEREDSSFANDNWPYVRCMDRSKRCAYRIAATERGRLRRLVASWASTRRPLSWTTPAASRSVRLGSRLSFVAARRSGRFWLSFPTTLPGMLPIGCSQLCSG